MHDLSSQRSDRIGFVYVITWLRTLFSAPTKTNSSLGRSVEWHPTHVHKKGGEYRLLEHAILEADRSEVVIYDDKEGTIWVRSKSEFYDGRFRPVE